MAAASSRPYQAWKTQEIASHFWKLRDDPVELSAAIAELNYRDGPKAQNLRRKLKSALADLNAGGASGKPAGETEFQRFMAQAISKLREKLIDISKANPLIAFRHRESGATYVRVVDELPDVIFGTLSSRSMTFESLPNPDQEPADQKTSEFKIALEKARLTDEVYKEALERLGGGVEDTNAAEAVERALIARVRDNLGLPRIAAGKAFDIAAFARANHFEPSFSLPRDGERAGPHLHDDRIRVLYTRDRLEARLRTVYDRYRSHAAETGIHTLQLAFGFVEWPEPDGLQERHIAPLILLPVQMNRELRAQKYVYKISGDDENLVVNMALQEMLRRNFNLKLPEPTTDDTPESYFAQVERLFSEDSGLKLLRFVTLAVLPFPNMAVWRDLDPDYWPDRELLSHHEVGLMLGATGGSVGSRAFPSDYDVEALPVGETPPLVMAADVSQHSALVDVQRGNSLALEGPPGTGKSQTIANLIAGAISKGKRVLFFAEKKAALDVVGKRLDELGFSPLMLELYSGRATKNLVIRDLEKRLEWPQNSDAKAIGEVRRDLAFRQGLLKRYRAVLRLSFGALRQPVNWLVWREMKLRADLENLVPKEIWNSEIAGAITIDAHGLKLRREALENVEATARAIADAYGTMTCSPWHAVGHLQATTFGHDEAMARLAEFETALGGLIVTCENSASAAGILLPASMATLGEWSARIERLPDAAGANGAKLSAAIRELELFRTLCGDVSEWQELRSRLSTIHPSPEDLDVRLVEHAERLVGDLGLASASLRTLESMGSCPIPWCNCDGGAIVISGGAGLVRLPGWAG